MSATHLAEPHVRVIRHARNGPDEKRPLPDAPAAVARVAMAPTVVDRMPVHPTARGLNRAAILQMQRMHGNRHVQRMLVRQSGPIVQRCGGTPCGCSQEEQVRHAVEQVPEVATATSTIAAMPVARRETLAQRLADPEHGPVLMQRLSEPGTGLAFLQRPAESGSVAMPAIQRQSLQRGWFDDEEESGTEDSGSSMWDSASETVGGAMDWAGEQAGGAADWASEQAGGAADWVSDQGGEAQGGFLQGNEPIDLGDIDEEPIDLGDIDEEREGTTTLCCPAERLRVNDKRVDLQKAEAKFKTAQDQAVTAGTIAAGVCAGGLAVPGGGTLVCIAGAGTALAFAKAAEGAGSEFLISEQALKDAQAQHQECQKDCAAGP